MKKNMYILGAITLAIFLLIIFIKNYMLETPLPEKFNMYKYLSQGPIESENYEIVKIIDGWKGKAEVNGIIYLKDIIYDPVTENILFITHPKEYEKIDDHWENKEPYQIFWKMDKSGREIDSLKIDYSLGLHNSGVFFYNDYFIDWVNNNDKTKQKYNDIINGDSLSEQQLENLISKATMLEATKDYDNEITNLFLKNVEGWTMIKSKKIYDRTERNWGSISIYTVKPYIESYKERFIILEDVISKLHKWTDPTNPIHTEHFVKKSKHSISLGDFNNNGRSGWDGIGYFSFDHHSEVINFKDYAFNKTTDKTRVYYPIDKNQDFAIIYISKRAADFRHYQNTGIFILRKK